MSGCDFRWMMARPRTVDLSTCWKLSRADLRTKMLVQDLPGNCRNALRIGLEPSGSTCNQLGMYIPCHWIQNQRNWAQVPNPNHAACIWTSPEQRRADWSLVERSLVTLVAESFSRSDSSSSGPRHVANYQKQSKNLKISKNVARVKLQVWMLQGFWNWSLFFQHLPATPPLLRP